MRCDCICFVCRWRTDSVLSQNNQRLRGDLVREASRRWTAGTCGFVATDNMFALTAALKSDKSSYFSIYQNYMRLDKDTMTGRSLCLTSPSAHKKKTVRVTAFPPSALLLSPRGLPLCLSSLFRWMVNSADILHCQTSNGLLHFLCPLGNPPEFSFVSSFSHFIALTLQI